MPYRHAHWWLLALFPLIVIAFWPNYLGRLMQAPFALHAHGLTATAWLLLLAGQSWSIHTRRRTWHRTAGLATFVIVPLFAAAGPLALQGMALLWRAGADPFHATYGARLVIVDMIAGPAVVALVAYAFVNRRDVAKHAAAMLATGLLVLPPIIGRILPALPGFPHGAWTGLGGFWLGFHLAEGLTLAIALWLAARTPAGRPGFGFAAAATVGEMVGYQTIGATKAWEQWIVVFTDIPAIPMALAGGLATAAVLWWAWRTVPPRPGRPPPGFAAAAVA